MSRLVTAAALLEAITGVALMGAPALVADLLLHAELAPAGVVVGRVAGAALLALGLACLPQRGAGPEPVSVLIGLLSYNVLVAGYMIALGIDGRMVGVLLWPGAALHSVLSLLLMRAFWIRHSPPPNTPAPNPSLRPAKSPLRSPTSSTR